VTFAFIERAAAMPFVEPGRSRRRSPIRSQRSSPSFVRRCCPGSSIRAPTTAAAVARDVRLFESGSVFPASGESRAVACCWLGAADASAHWSGSGRQADFFDAKGVATLICAAFGLTDLEAVPCERPYLVRGRAAELRVGDRLLGWSGNSSPRSPTRVACRRVSPCYVAELDIERLDKGLPGEGLRAEPLPRFPSIVRDVSLLLDEALPAAAVRGTIRAAAPATLVSVVEFDRYQGKGIPDGRISLSLRLTFRSADRTLTDDEVQEATDRILAALVRQLERSNDRARRT
jgi:phenylalanyl-tRNA synthetase beta chain